MRVRRRIGQERDSRPIPKWAVVSCIVAALCLAAQAVLPLLHVVASHPHGIGCCIAHVEPCTGANGLSEQGLRAMDRSDGSPAGPDRCRTCDELVLVKLIVPWTAPSLGLLPDRVVAPAAEMPASRVLPVCLTSTAPRGPPARA